MSTESGMVLVPRVLVECVANILEIEKYSVDGCMIKGLREALAAAPASPPTPALDGARGKLINALRSQQQCDQDGVMCIVSRQAVNEAIALLEKVS